MFKFLKDKLKGAIDKFSKGVEEEGAEEIKEVEVAPDTEPKKEGFFSKLLGKKEETVIPTEQTVPVEESKEDSSPKETSKKPKVSQPVNKVEKKSKAISRPEKLSESVVEDSPVQQVQDAEPQVRDTQGEDISIEEKPLAEDASFEDSERDKLEIDEPLEEVTEEITELEETAGDEVLEKKTEESEKPLIDNIDFDGTSELLESVEPEKNIPESPGIESLSVKIPTKEPVKKGFFSKISDIFHKEEVKPETALEQSPQVTEEPESEYKKSELKVATQPKTPELESASQVKKDSQQEKKSEPKIQPEQRKEEQIKEMPKISIPTPTKEESVSEEPEDKGFFARIKQSIVTKKISKKQFDELFWDIELAMLENNVAVEVMEKIKSDLSEKLVDKPIPRKNIQETIIESLKESIVDLFNVPTFELSDKIKEKKPFVICFVGVNGSGKTTSIAKVAHLLKSKNLEVVLAAGDTFRAAAIDQLDLHAQKLGVKCIKHDYGSDSAAVAFDAIKHAEQKNKDVVLIDTAGRLHSNKNLMEELRKVIRVAKPDLTIFVGESITGNDCVEQAKQFGEVVPIDGIILSKADVDEKGGAAISVSYITKKPILFMGVGQEYKDLQVFDPKLVVEGLGL